MLTLELSGPTGPQALATASEGALSGPLAGSEGFGDVFTQISDILTKAPKYVDIITQILEDPALDPVVARVKTIKALNAATSKTPSTAPTTPTKGIGLQKAVKPLDYYITYLRNKWIVPVGITGIILVPLCLGFGLGYAVKAHKVKRHGATAPTE